MDSIKSFIAEAVKWCVENKFELLIGVGFFGLFIWIVTIVITWLILYFSPLELSPRSKKIICSSESPYQKEEYYIFLRNKDTRPLYDINLTLRHPKGVRVTLHPEKESENKMLDGLSVDFASFQIIGFDKHSGIVQTVVNNLAPTETVKVKVSIDKNKCEKNFKIKIAAKFNSREPKPIISTAVHTDKPIVQNKNEIAELIISGNQLLDQVKEEYFRDRKKEGFDIAPYLLRWKDNYRKWHLHCLETLLDPVEKIKFKNAQSSPMAHMGTNFEWNGIVNQIEARLGVLDEIYSKRN